MRVTLAEKFKDAFAEAGKELPKVSRPELAAKPCPKHKRPNAAINNQKGRNKQHCSKSVPGHEAAKGEADKASKRKKGAITPASTGKLISSQKKQPHLPQTGVVIPQRKATPSALMSPDLSVYRNGVEGSKAPRAAAAASGPAGSYRVSLKSSSKPVWENEGNLKAPPPLLVFALTGQDVQCWPQDKPVPTAAREIVLGLDFGTSTVKAVFGDSSIGRHGRSFAVPFRKDQGLASYLLPCRLYQRSGLFSLEKGEKVYSDLKLDLLANYTSADCQQRVVAFLALVIRQARAWLFTQHASIFKSSNLVWKLSVGLPSESHFTSREAPLFELLGCAAWILAGSTAKVLDVPAVAAALGRARHLQAGDVPASHEDVEVSVVPEIAAQIYGYVASEQFDRDAPNDFMMADIGAGTVDVSLFHVKPGRGRKWDFEFYTTVVKPYGAINLHRHRLDWWESAIKKDHSELSSLISAIADGLKVSDIQAGLPARLEDYFTDSMVDFMNPEDHLDLVFFKNVFSQVFHEGYWKASAGYLSRDELNNIPVYLCGGGSRHPLYQELTKANSHKSFYSWMRVNFRALNKPSNLDAPGLSRQDFDRLSVAYGLSFLDVGKVVKAIPRPQRPPIISDAWRENYIEK